MSSTRHAGERRFWPPVKITRHDQTVLQEGERETKVARGMWVIVQGILWCNVGQMCVPRIDIAKDSNCKKPVTFCPGDNQPLRQVVGGHMGREEWSPPCTLLYCIQKVDRAGEPRAKALDSFTRAPLAEKSYQATKNRPDTKAYRSFRGQDLRHRVLRVRARFLKSTGKIRTHDFRFVAC